MQFAASKMFIRIFKKLHCYENVIDMKAYNYRDEIAYNFPPFLQHKNSISNGVNLWLWFSALESMCECVFYVCTWTMLTSRVMNEDEPIAS